MPHILFYYVLRLFFKTGLAIASVLLIVLLISQVPTALQRVAAHEIAPDILLNFIAWMTIGNLSAILPITVLLTIVVSLGRLSSDQELTAMRASGISMLSLLMPVTWFVAPIFLLQTALAFYFAPNALCSALKERSQAMRSIALAPIRPGQFHSLGDKTTFFVGAVASDGGFRDLFIDQRTEGASVVILAKRGRLEEFPSQDRVDLSLYSGQRYEGVAGSAAFRTVSFSQYNTSIALPALMTHCTRSDSRSTAELWASLIPNDRAELSWRIALPLMLLILALLALPLSITRPRVGPFARVPHAIALFVLYLYSTMGLADFSIRNPGAGVLSFWSLHLIMISAGVFALFRAQKYSS